MSDLEYIPSYESQRDRRLSLEQELHRAESIYIEDALPEGFNVDENDSLGHSQKTVQGNPNKFKSIIAMIFCCQI